MKIYTKTGDKGQTSLANGKRVSKTDERIEAYGTADELNSFLGLLCAALNTEKLPETAQQLYWIQNRLFDLGACLAGASLALQSEDIAQLEQWIDLMQEKLPQLKAFILPAGNEATCRAHVCRTVTRRLERKMLACCNNNWTNELTFVNRLSDYFFVLARYIAFCENVSELTWKK